MSVDFNKAQNAATKLLIRQNLSGLYIDVRKFNFFDKIRIDTIQNYCSIVRRPLNDFICDESRECCVLKLPKERHLILYNDAETNEERKHWGIAHEVGHIYLGHEHDGPDEEIEAHFFAAQITMPEIALYYIARRLGYLTPNIITCYFNASYVSACKRIDTLNRRRRINSGSIDKYLLSLLQPHIEHCFKAPVYGTNNAPAQYWNVRY